jgi:hypothetical protein
MYVYVSIYIYIDVHLMIDELDDSDINIACGPLLNDSPGD